MAGLRLCLRLKTHLQGGGAATLRLHPCLSCRAGRVGMDRPKSRRRNSGGMEMAKRPLMDVSDLVGDTPQAAPAPDVEEEVSTIYARIPRTLFMQLRRRAFELSEGKRKKVTQQDIITAALKKYFDN